MVLAEHAGQIAAREEDGARTPATHQGRLLTEMRTGTLDAGELTGAADAQLAGQAIDPALPRAQVALTQPVAGARSAPLQFPRTMQSEISGPPGSSRTHITPEKRV